MQKFYIDWGFFIANLFFASFSLFLIWSNNSSFLKTQFIFFLIGFLLFILFSQFDSNILENFAVVFYLFSVIFLVVTLFNVEVRGANRWVDILGFRMQPSELVKPFLIISFAYFMNYDQRRTFSAYLKRIFIYFLPLIVVFLQPDLGNFVIYFFFLIAMLIANNFNLKLIFVFFLLSISISPFFWRILKEYQRQRILTFLNSQTDPQGAGYNAMQSMIAVGSGGLFGLGLGRGTQSHLRFLPENHTDFIFASLTEELGLLGALILLSLYFYIFWRILKLALGTTNKFHYLIYIGIFSQLISQVFINISMNIGLIPITGVTLPLISTGGSSIIATFIALGIVISLKRKQRVQPIVIR